MARASTSRVPPALPYAAQMAIFSRFRAADPHPVTELHYVNAFTLLVAVALSAQATDAGVNKATAPLFERVTTPQQMLDLGVEALTELVAQLHALGVPLRLARVKDRVRELLADAAPPGHIKRQRIDLAPVQTFLSGGAWPVYGDDPRSLDKQKVFSVAPLRQDGQLRGYLYIILQGETFNELAASAWQKTLWSLLLWTLLLVAVLGGLAGWLAWFWVTRPVRQLTALVATDSQDSNITIVKKTRVAYNKGNKVNTWTTYGAGKKLVGQVKSGYKFMATGQAQYKGRTWYRIKDNKIGRAHV